MFNTDLCYSSLILCVLCRITADFVPYVYDEVSVCTTTKYSKFCEYMLHCLLLLVCSALRQVQLMMVPLDLVFALLFNSW